MTQYPPPTPSPPPPPAFNPRPLPTGTSLQANAAIQGNILAGFNKDHSALLFLELPNQAAGQAFLAELVPLVATNAEVAAFNASFSQARTASGGDPDDLNATWIGVSVTAHGLGQLAPPALSGLATPGWDPGVDRFIAGATTAPDIPASGPESASSWYFGRPDQQIDLVATVASDSAEGLAGAVGALGEIAARHGVLTVFRQDGATLPAAGRGHEHFGFKDGISQPAVVGFDAAGPDGQPLIETGEFVLGYPGHNRNRPVPTWMFDGSFLVIRRLAQDVAGWWGQAETLASSLTPPMGAEAVAAKLVGRWRDGTPVALDPDNDPRVGPDLRADNAFSYSDDPSGANTPLFAHIRKLNPRSGAVPGADAVAQHRIIRRGVPFGAPFDPSLGRDHGTDAERGLVFACYQASIADQFEFLQQSWADAADFPSAGTGPDAVIGPAGTCALLRAQGAAPLAVKRVITIQGSLYAFAPSLDALAALASGTPLSG